MRVAHAFTTLPTGGFSPEPRSIEVFTAASQWVIVVFMVLAGMNFALLYRLSSGEGRAPPCVTRRCGSTSTILALMSVLLAVELWDQGLAERRGGIPARHVPGGVDDDDDRIREHGLHRLARARVDDRSSALMFVGGSAGSTGGAIKVVRHLLLGKVLRRELRQTLHPEVVMPIRLNGAVVDERTLRAITAFVLLYVGLFAAGAGLIALDAAFQGRHLRRSTRSQRPRRRSGTWGRASASPGRWARSSRSATSRRSVMTALMWLGRLEVIPVVVLLTRGYWRARDAPEPAARRRRCACVAEQRDA